MNIVEMEIILTWDEFYSVLHEQSVRLGNDGLYFVYSYNKNTKKMKYEYLHRLNFGFITLTLYPPNQRIYRDPERLLFPVTKPLFEFTDLDELASEIFNYEMHYDVKRGRIFNENGEIYVSIIPDLSEIDITHEHFIKVMLDVLS